MCFCKLRVKISTQIFFRLLYSFFNINSNYNTRIAYSFFALSHTHTHVYTRFDPDNNTEKKLHITVSLQTLVPQDPALQHHL